MEGKEKNLEIMPNQTTNSKKKNANTEHTEQLDNETQKQTGWKAKHPLHGQSPLTEHS